MKNIVWYALLGIWVVLFLLYWVESSSAIQTDREEGDARRE